MSKAINLGSLSIPITQYASQGNAVLGIRDSGKTYSATYLAECLLGAKIPFVAFDPSGTWRFLRTPGAGKGFPVVVAGGMQPDLPLTPQSAPEIVRAAMKANVSLVIDLYSMDLSKADWSRIVESCVRVLLYENGKHGLRHVFIEEAAEFVPQQIQGDKARVYAEVEKLARIGGNALLGYTLINQRAEQVNKAVLELCDCLFLHRQKGKNSIKSLEKWLELSTGGDVKQIIKGLPQLPSGEAWVWPAHADHAVHVKMPQKQSFHPDRRALSASPASANMERVDAGQFVEQLKGTLEKFVQEAEANDPATLKKRIAELERQVRKAAPSAPVATTTSKQDQESARQLAADNRKLRTAIEDLMKFVVQISAKDFEPADGQALNKALEAALAQARKGIENSMVTRNGELLSIRRQAEGLVRRVQKLLESQDVEVELNVQKTEPFTVQPQRPRPERQPASNVFSNGSLGKGEAATLAACIQYPDGLRREQLTVLTGYKRSSRDAYIQRLREKGYVETIGERVTATAEGVAALPNAEPLPTGEALQQFWMQRLPEGERKILAELITSYPEAVDRADLDERTGYQRSSRDAYIQRLRAKQLVVDSSRGQVMASETLF